MRKYSSTIIILLILSSCKSIDLEKINAAELKCDESSSTLEEEMQKNEDELNGYYVQEELKVQDIESTIVYVDRPVYIPEPKDVQELEKDKKTGHEASVESLKKATVKPENYKMGTFYYQYNENLVYEVYAQPYHLTDIILEPGEVVIGTPLLSEDESVWELTANVAKDPVSGEDIQHLFIKPSYSSQDSTLIIITDRRVYHFRIKSFSDTHMAMVKFTYPQKRNQWAKSAAEKAEGRSVENDFIRISNPELLSFDYKMKYSIFRKPEFLPTRVYDDGQATYIQIDDIVLQKKLPVLFNEKNEIVNYSVKKNVFVIPRLINKITLRLGKEKVVIEKKKTKLADVESQEQSSGE